MSVADSARAERAAYAGYRCEGGALCHRDCPGEMTTTNAHQFVIHHRIRLRKDQHDPNWAHRDDVEHLALLWNGTTGLGAGGCHGRVHTLIDLAREHGLIAPRQLADVLPFRPRTIDCVEVEDTRTSQVFEIPKSMLPHLNEHARILGPTSGGAA